MGYGCNDYDVQGALHFGSTRARKCIQRQIMEMVCTPRIKAERCSGDSGGPLVKCTSGLTGCRQIGVATNHKDGIDYYVSVYAEKAFIQNALDNLFYRTIDGPPTRTTASQNHAVAQLYILGLSFFAMIPILR